MDENDTENFVIVFVIFYNYLIGNNGKSLDFVIVQLYLELRIRFSFLHHGQIVAQGSETRLEFFVLQLAALVLVEVFEHHGTFAKYLLRHATLVASLDLLFQIVLHPHAYVRKVKGEKWMTDNRKHHARGKL